MLRSLHRLPGLAAALLVVILAVSGALLSAFPALDRAAAPAAAPELSVAELAARVAVHYPGVSEIRRAPSGRITAFFDTEDGASGRAAIDPATGAGRDLPPPGRFRGWMTELHRALFIGDAGRIGTAAGALAMLVLSVSGLLLVARRVGGWRRFFSRARGGTAARLHVEAARLAAPALILSGVTALVMSASTFGLLPEDAANPAFPLEVSGTTAATPAALPGLRAVPVSALRSLAFPWPGDAQDVYTLTTATGMSYVDQGSGDVLAWAGNGPWARVVETAYMLHTGQGLWALGLLLGMAALLVPAMAASGVMLWRQARRGRPKMPGAVPAARADTLILVGSEGGSSWGFAATLSRALTGAGFAVAHAPMSGFDARRYPRLARVIVLAATYGDGTAPASARGFLDRLAVNGAPGVPLAVLGFGDRAYPAFCGFARAVEAAARAAGWPRLMPMGTVDRQSPQDFAAWGRELGRALGVTLELAHVPVLPACRELTLVSRRDYGAEVQAPTAILRFALPRARLWQRLTGRGWPRFAAGDLLGILPEGETLPRFYSLASSSRDGFVEICVRKLPGGVCSGTLHGLRPGDAIRAFVRPNPAFRPARGRRPVVMIGAGTGIGPLAGFARANARRRAMHLYFGARHPGSDLLYDRELGDWQAEGRLASVTTAFSRQGPPSYVQDALRRDAEALAQLLRDGAQVLVCGGRDMARGVATALEEILAPAGLSPAVLKAEGRYVEDVY